MGKLASQYVLVTGGTRGTGRETVLALLERGETGIIFLYRNKVDRALKLVQEAAQLAPSAHVVPLQCDITNSDQLSKIGDTLAELGGAQLSGLFLVASGGLEPGMPEDYAMRMNRDAQVAVVNTCWGHLEDGATIIFDTSHWAHMWGMVEQLPDYEPIASTKNEGERALRQLVIELENTKPRGVRFVVITADMLTDSMVVRLMERKQSGLVAARQAVVGEDNPLPKYRDLGVANATAFLDPNTNHGAIVVIGGALDTLTLLAQPA